MFQLSIKKIYLLNLNLDKGDAVVEIGLEVVMIGLNPNSSSGVKFLIPDFVVFENDGFKVVINLGPGDPPLGFTAKPFIWSFSAAI